MALRNGRRARARNGSASRVYLKTNESNLEDYLTSPAVNLNGALVKMTLPRAQARQALQDLILMGIHHGTIFPGREGIAQTIKLRNLLRRDRTVSFG